MRNWNVEKHIIVITVTKVQKIKLTSIHGIISIVVMVVSLSISMVRLMVLIGVMVSMVVV